jgi:hypothetical protein
MRSYRYTTTDGQPLRSCPTCGADLTAADAIELELVSDRGRFLLPTCLKANGMLMDPWADLATATSHVLRCDCCTARLKNHPDVEEHKE